MARQTLLGASDALSMLSMLYPDLKVALSDVAVENDEQAFFGTYIDDDDTPVALCAVDRAYAAFLGAALTLIPAETAQEMAVSGDLNDGAVANLKEVMNILSRLYMGGTSPHLRFANIRMNKGELTEPEAAILSNCAARLDMKMAVPNYGIGQCSLISL